MADIALIEKYGTEGVTLDDMHRLYNMIPTEEAYLCEFDAYVVESTAIGIMTPDCAAGLGFETERNSELHAFVASILDDVDNESEGGTYDYKGYTLSLVR